MLYFSPLSVTDDKQRDQYSVFSNCLSTVTVSPSGPPGLFKGVTTAMSGVLARFPLLLPVRNSFASYGASAVTRTRDREVPKDPESLWGPENKAEVCGVGWTVGGNFFANCPKLREDEKEGRANGRGSHLRYARGSCTSRVCARTSTHPRTGIPAGPVRTI